MKKIGLFLLILIATIVYSQDKIVTKTGTIAFESLYLTAFQDVKAVNEEVTGVLNSKTGEFACLALIKGFRFEVALMEEHFNENYMESDTYPKAVFRGQIQNFDVKQLTGSEKEYFIKGTLELHGKIKEVMVISKIKKTNLFGIELTTLFYVVVSDFGIPVPSVVKGKVSEKMKVNTAFKFPVK
jgi:hypothetical protein